MLCINFDWKPLENSSNPSNVGHTDGYLTRNDKHLVKKRSQKYQVLLKSVLVVSSFWIGQGVYLIDNKT